MLNDIEIRHLWDYQSRLDDTIESRLLSKLLWDYCYSNKFQKVISEKESFVHDSIAMNKDADEQVLYFIVDFLFHCGIDNVETLRYTFHSGYCLYFARMLKDAFNRGEVCWAAPFGHFVWKDENGVCYDVEGVTISEAEYFIPESYLGDAIKDFLHVRWVGNDTSAEEIQQIISKYKEDRGEY